MLQKRSWKQLHGVGIPEGERDGNKRDTRTDAGALPPKMDAGAPPKMDAGAPPKMDAGAPPPPPAHHPHSSSGSEQRGSSSRMRATSQKPGHVHEVVQSADAEGGVAPLCPHAWRSIEGYVRPCARDGCASVLSVCA